MKQLFIFGGFDGCKWLNDICILDIGKLEEYIEQSQCILVFLSRNYFFSTNCLRELDHALARKRRLLDIGEGDAADAARLSEEIRRLEAERRNV